jgi:hypothetical protein
MGICTAENAYCMLPVGERMEKKDWCVFEIRIESHSYYKVVWYLGVEAAFYSADAIML